MKANEVTFNSFLQSPKTQFVIPVYQRNYDWMETQCGQLLNDILDAGRKSGETHFIGSIVFIHDGVYTSSEVKKLVIIDGQQRLTTLSLLYLALHKFAAKNNLEEKANEIKELYLVNRFVKDDGSKLKLKQSDVNAKAFAFLLSDEDPGKYPEYSRLIENYKFFYKSITHDNVNSILQGIACLLFVEISLERGKDDPQRIFESLNSTGLELSQADLIRNYILMGLDPDEQVRIFEKYWEIIEANSRDDEKEESRVSDFIRDYLTFKSKKIPNKNRVYEEFKTRYATRDTRFYSETLNELKEFSYHYSKFLNPTKEIIPEIQKELQYIQRLEINTCYPFLMPVFDDHRRGLLNTSDLQEILRLIQSYTWRRFVVNLPTASTNKMFMTLYTEINPSDYLTSLEKALVKKKGTLRFPTNEEVAVALPDKDIYNAQAKNRTYLFELLENHENREFVSVENPNLTIEHIFPQNPDKTWYAELPEQEIKALEKHVHTLANLTLSGNNGNLSNKSFREKKEMNIDGKQQGYKFSRLWLNQFLREIDAWTTDNLKARHQTLLERFFDVWEYPEVDIDEEIEIDEDFTIYNAPDPKNRKLDYFIFRDEKIETAEVTQMYTHVISKLYQENPSVFFHPDIQSMLGLSSAKDSMRNPFPLSTTIYLETGLNNNTKFNKLKNLLPKFNAEEELVINFSSTIDGQDQVINADFWKAKCSDETWELFEELQNIITSFDPEFEPLFKVRYIGIKKGDSPNNFLVFTPNASFIRIGAKVSDAEEFASEIKGQGIEFLSIGKRFGRLKFRLNRRTFNNNREFISRLFSDAHQNSLAENESHSLSSKTFQLDFWTRFRDGLRSTNEFTRLHTPRPQYWFNVPIGKSNIHLSAVCNTSKSFVGIKVYIRGTIAENMLPFLEKHKNEIETHIGQKLNWNPFPEKQDKIIMLDYPTDLNDPKKLDEALQWLIKYTMKFREIFSKVVSTSGEQ